MDKYMIAVALLMAAACYLEGNRSEINGRPERLWWVLVFLLAGAALAVYCISGGWSA